MLKTFLKICLALAFCGLVLIAAYSLYFINGVNFIYGAHTEEVDHRTFAQAQEMLAIVDVSVLSPDGQTMLPNRTVTVNRGEIVSVVEGGPIPANARVIHGEGKYLIPGLVDSHVHILKSPNDLLLYVANGVTHIRDLGGPSNRLLLREEIAKGRIGPRMFVSSPPINSMPYLQGAFREVISFHKNTHDVQHAEAMVADFIQQGYDAIKIYHLDMATYRAVNALAAESGLPTTGHFPLMMEMSELEHTQQREVAHLEEIVRVLIREFGSISEKGESAFYAHVEERSEAIIDKLLAKDIVVNSVLWFMESIHSQLSDLDSILKTIPMEYANPGIVEGTDEAGDYKVGWLPGFNQFEAVSDPASEDYQKSSQFWLAREKAHHILMKRMIARGVTLVAGTDSGANLVVPGFSLHDELESLNAAGMTPAQALATATQQPAAMMKSNAGIIAAGKRADLVLLNDNPLNVIGNTREIASVVINGRFLSRETLDAMLLAVKEANNRSRKVSIDKYL